MLALSELVEVVRLTKFAHEFERSGALGLISPASPVADLAGFRNESFNNGELNQVFERVAEGRASSFELEDWVSGVVSAMVAVDGLRELVESMVVVVVSTGEEEGRCEIA